MKSCAALGVVAAALVSALTAIGVTTASPLGRPAISCPLGAPAGITAVAFTPRGDRLAYARGDSITVTTLGGRIVDRLDAAAAPAQMAWGPQGQAIAYVSGNELHILAGGDALLFRAPGALELGGWLPDGASVVVSTRAEAYLVTAGGTIVRDLGEGAHAMPSPDGTRVAVVAPGADPNTAEIQVIDLETDARTTIFRAPAPQFPPAALITALAWSPNSRQVAFLWDIDVEPDLLAQNADGSSTGTFGREHGALPSEIGMTGPFQWTRRGIVGEALSEDGGSFIAFYDTETGKERGLGVYQYRSAFLGSSRDGAHVAYNAIGPDGALQEPGLRTAEWNAKNDRPFLPCNGTARADRIRASAEPTTIRARAGNDLILSRNHQRDVIDCGPGIDTAYVDRRDAVRNCEHVRRLTTAYVNSARPTET